MGWAKYYEDNISIYNNRMALVEPFTPAFKECCMAKKLAHNPQGPILVSRKKDCRFGIMLSFEAAIDGSVARKLQMNGWWFSKANNCWCNYNNRINRQYAQRLILGQMASITFAA